MCFNISNLQCFCPDENVGAVVDGRFADIFGARAALSLSCSATIVFFLLLAIASSPAMLFLHKVPTVFMHVLPGEHHASTILLTKLNILNFKHFLETQAFKTLSSDFEKHSITVTNHLLRSGGYSICITSSVNYIITTYS